MDGAVRGSCCRSHWSQRECEARKVIALPSALPSHARLTESRGKDWNYEQVGRSPGKVLRLQQPVGTLITSEGE